MATKADPSVGSDIQDLGLAEQGKRRIDWAFQSMPVLQATRKHFIKTQPLAGLRVVVCLHVTSETANLMVTLRDGGASLVLCASNPLSTQDDVAASLIKDYGIPVHGQRGDSAEVTLRHYQAAAETQPHLVFDSGGEMTTFLQSRAPECARELFGVIEETSTGAGRLRSLSRKGLLPAPAVAAHDAQTTHLFDNRHGAGQSTLDGIIRSTRLLIGGLTVVVAGYGWCGKGIAARSRGLGAQVIVTEVDPLKAIEAAMDGFRVMAMVDAAQIGDLFVTATGNRHVIGREHFERLKSGATLANGGHSHVEIDLGTLGRMASSRRPVREHVEEYVMRDGRRIHVLAEGRLINLAAADGHPASVMDIGFANQALAAEFVVRQRAQLERRVYAVPEEIDRQVARMKLEALGMKIDRLSHEQEAYLASLSEGM